MLEARARSLKAAFDHRSETGFLLGQTLVMLGRSKEALPYFKASLNFHVIILTVMQDYPSAKALGNDPGYAALFAEVRARMHGGYPRSPPVVQVSMRIPN